MCRPLKAEEIECRVAQVSAKGCSLLLYKTARVDRAILTETYGDLWQNDFKTIDGKMYGGIGIYNQDLKEWLWRWDCGTESNTEAEKGQASDCFKRAGFKWGIGIELYSTPFIWVNCETEQYNGKYKLKNKFEKFDVKEIGCDANRNINQLVITDSKGNTVFVLGKVAAKEVTKQKTVSSSTNITEPITPAEEQELDTELKDLDLFNGLRACSDMANLKKYWSENQNKVSDIDAFTKVKDEMKKKLGGIK